MIGEMLLVLGAAVVLDFVIGDPPIKLHPTAWLGRLIAVITPRLKSKNAEGKGKYAKAEMIKGSIAAVAIISLVVSLTYYLLHLIEEFLGIIVLILVSILLLKSTFAIKGMETHARSVMYALSNNDIVAARTALSNIVGRDTSQLDEQHIISATLESVGESTVDGITSPIFYFAFFGIPGAFAYRAINTLDSMIGYKDDYHKKIGWFSAHMDTLANYIPARLTAFFMVMAARIIGADWKNSLYIMGRDRDNTPSMNGGWSMATIAGTLRVRLEKNGYYSLGEGYESLTLEHCEMAISIMK
ncbi:MAG: cobalamin biosynthesis protein, partial [Nitrososphaerales archaeon]